MTSNRKTGRKGILTATLWTTVLLLAVAVIILYYRFDPEKYTFFPKCLFHSATGLRCPGCGIQSAIHHVLNGNMTGAFRANALAMLLVPYSLIGIFLNRFRNIYKDRKYGRFLEKAGIIFYHNAAVWVVFTLVMAFWIFRNIFPMYL